MELQLKASPVRVAQSAAYRKIGDRYYVYSPSTGETICLGGLGATVWENLVAGLQPYDLAKKLSDRFLLPQVEVAQDIEGCLDELVRYDLVSSNGSAPLRRRAPDCATRWQPQLGIAEMYAQRVPFRIDFETTYTCNLDCAYCYTPKDNQQLLNTREIGSILGQLAQAGTLFLVFTGGEPFSRPDLETLIQQAREHKFALMVLTNATMLTPPRAAILAQTSTVQVSLHGASAATHDAFTGIDGSFTRACRGIQFLAQAGANVYVIFNATQHNIQEEEAVRDLCAKWGVGFLLNVHILPNVGTGSLDSLEYRVSDQHVQNLVRQGKLTRSQSLCIGGFTKARISPSGDVFPCELVRQSFGNLRTRTFGEIWHSQEFEAFRTSEFFDIPIACKQCKWQRFCRRCPALAEMEDQNVSGPSREACRIARLISESQERQGVQRE